MYKQIYPVLLASFLLAGCTSTGGTNTTVIALEPTEGTVKVAAEDANGETIVVEYDASEVPASALETTEEAGMVAALPASSEAESESQQVAVQPASAVASSSVAAETSTEESSSVEETTVPADGFIATGMVRCISDGARVRETPRGTILGNLSYGDTVQTDGETENGWIHIKSEMFGIGYVYQDFVTSVQ